MQDMVFVRSRVSRRLGLGLLVLCASVPAFAAPAGARTAPARASRQPNIILFQTDDQALSQFNGTSMPEVTKYLADKGTQFDHAYLTTPLCCPSRATLLTGQYGHNNGVLRNLYPLLKDQGSVLPVWLRRAGYVTAHVGKFLNAYHPHLNPLAPAPGWTQWHTLLNPGHYYDYDLSVNGRRVHYGENPSDYSTRVFDRTGLQLVDRYLPDARPLYLQMDEVAPHVSMNAHPSSRFGCSPIPDPLDLGLFSDATLPGPPSFDEPDMSDKPSFMRTLPPFTNAQVGVMTRRYRCGLAALRAVDRSVGGIVREVQRLGELGQTVFIFYTDNGVFYGEHRVPSGKQNPYEEAASTPLVMRVPGRYLSGNAAVGHVSEPVANIDFAPTILDLAHAQPCRGVGGCRTMDGRSLTPLIAGRTPVWAANRPIGVEINVGFSKEVHGICQYSGVRADGQVLIHYVSAKDPGSAGCISDHEWERYDLTNDPFELENLCFGGTHANCPQDQSERRLEGLVKRIGNCAGVAGRDPRTGNRPYCG